MNNQIEIFISQDGVSRSCLVVPWENFANYGSTLCCNVSYFIYVCNILTGRAMLLAGL